MHETSKAAVAQADAQWCYGGDIKMRTQVSMDSELYRLAKKKAADLGISLAEYLRRLIAQDVNGLRGPADPSLVFNLFDSGLSDVSSRHDHYLNEAVDSEHSRETGSPAGG